MISVIGNSDNVTAGRISAQATAGGQEAGRPPTDRRDVAATVRGQPCSVTANEDQQNADQKFGNDTPMSETVSKTATASYPVATRCKRPISKPPISASPPATSASSSVAGSRS